MINDIYNTFIISDHHFFHEKIIDYCNRPFNSVNEINLKSLLYPSISDKLARSGVTGISLPIITFSFSPINLSSLARRDAVVKISVVCSNEAADSQLSV